MSSSALAAFSSFFHVNPSSECVVVSHCGFDWSFFD